MVAGSWFNSDGLYIQYGTQKAIPDLGGEWLAYGQTRVVEVYISISPTTFGNPTLGSAIQIGALPTSFVGTSTAATAALSAGIQTINTFLPLQTQSTISTATAGQGILLNQEQIWIDGAEWLQLIGITGAGSFAGLTGVGLVSVLTPAMTVAVSTTGLSQFVQVAPNAGIQLMGAASTAAMSTGMRYTFTANSSQNAMAAWPTTALAQGGSTPAGGVWGGNVPIASTGNCGTNPTWVNPMNPSGLPTWAYISAIGSSAQLGGTTGNSAGAGLAKFRVYWTKYGTINV